MHRKRKLPLLLLALLVAGGTAFAFVPVPDGNRLEVARPGWEDEGLWIEAGFDNAMSKVSPLSALAERYGGEWRYDRNRVTGSLHHVYGSGVDFAGAIHADADAERAARDFVAENARLFGAATEDLRVSRVQTAPGKYAVHFDQFVDGVRVFGGNAHVVLTDAGRIFAFGSDAYPRVKELLPGTTPALSEAEALAEAKNEIDFLDGRDEITYQELVILPTREGAGEELALTYHLAYRFDLFTWDPRGHWETYVDAHTGEILWRRSLIFPLDFTGHARGDVEWEGYCDGYTYDFPMEQMQLTISGVGIATTDIDGDFTLSYGGTDSKSITARFQSAFLHTHRYTGTDAVLTGTITPGTPYTIDWSNSNSLDSERDTYAFLNREHRWLKALDPTFTGLDYAMPDTVERTDGYCPGNAWYDYYGVNFCVGSIDYANTGRMGDVAYHEYGHGITHELYNPYDPPSSVHEGNSDIASLFLTREPRLGLGFYLDNCTSGIRNADNSLIYPDDLTGSGHTDGQMLSGFIYDSWQALLGAYSQTYADSVVEYAWWFGRKLGLPQSMPDQVYWTFVGDDDDGNLDNGTPHHAMFCVGATNHGFDCPEILSPVAIAHTPITEHTTAADPIPVTATITSGAGDIEESALRVYYKVDGGSLLNVGMAGGGGDVYTGTIPAQSAGAFVQYYLYAEDEYANSAVSPSNAPVDLYGFYVGEFTLVFEDDFETDKGWTVGDAGDDATTGIWER
ncbi:MAG: PepSY domain-containing protein, partial [Candidatus Eisenbacteria bacterium]|nr:PepSY domain-containing protein [Candidatus Eisenbacteria bacterium]